MCWWQSRPSDSSRAAPRQAQPLVVRPSRAPERSSVGDPTRSTPDKFPTHLPVRPPALVDRPTRPPNLGRGSAPGQRAPPRGLERPPAADVGKDLVRTRPPTILSLRAACLGRRGGLSPSSGQRRLPPLALTTPPIQLWRQPSAELLRPALACWQAGASMDSRRPAPALSSPAGWPGRPCSRVASPPHRPYVASREQGGRYALARRPVESGGRGRLSANGAHRGVANARRPLAGDLEGRAALHPFLSMRRSRPGSHATNASV